jgi:hypothetical protein
MKLAIAILVSTSMVLVGCATPLQYQPLDCGQIAKNGAEAPPSQSAPGPQPGQKDVGAFLLAYHPSAQSR